MQCYRLSFNVLHVMHFTYATVNGIINCLPDDEYTNRNMSIRNCMRGEIVYIFPDFDLSEPVYCRYLIAAH